MSRPLIAIAALATAACRDHPTVQVRPPDTPLMVCIGDPTVNPPSSTLHRGDTLRLRASGSNGCQAITQWRWRSSDTLVASVDSLQGLVLARQEGVASIVAAAVDDPNIRAAAAIVVKP